MLGILVHGDNHFIVQGPLPDEASARQLVRHWSVIQICQETPPELQQWTIISRAFREDLEWAVVVPGDGERNPDVSKLLEELAQRRITIHDAGRG
jgi:hypothetical protein